MLAENDLLKKGGKLWLPNLDCVHCSLGDYKEEIEKHYTIEAVEDPNMNPLYAATENVETELLRCPDSLTNETQLRPLLIYSRTPFLVLSRRHTPLIHCVTPSGRGERAPRHQIMTEHDIAPCNLAETHEELSSMSIKRGGKEEIKLSTSTPRKKTTVTKITLPAKPKMETSVVSPPRKRKLAAVI